jgi:hypothetical protein
MRLGRSLLGCLLAIAAVNGCASTAIDRPSAPSTASREFFPLRPGTFWVYEVRDAAGSVALERVLVRGSYYLKTVEQSGIVVEESGGMGGELDLDVSWHPVVYYQRGGFLYKFDGVNYVDEELQEVALGQGEEKVLPSDPTAHPEWESDFQIFHIGHTEGYGARMVSVANPAGEPVRVRAGTFHGCLRVDSESVLSSRQRRAQKPPELTFRYVDWYAPGVGLVRSEVHASESDRPVSTVELVSFRDGGHDR